MKKQIKKMQVCIICAMLAVSISGCRIGNTEFVLSGKSFQSNTLFTLNDKKCTFSEAKIYLCNYSSLYGTAFDYNLWSGGFDTAKLETYVKDISLAEVEQIYSINEMAGKLEISLSDEENSLVEDIAGEYYESLSDDELEFIGGDRELFVQAYKRYALATKVYRTAIEGANEEVSDDEARVMHVLKLFVGEKSKADIVAQELQRGDDFLNVATAHNEAGEVDSYVRRGEYPADMEKLLYNLEDGEITSAIQADNGYYFVKCLNKFEVELTDQNKETIRKRKQQEQFQELYGDSVETSSFQLNEEGWSKVHLDQNYRLNSNSFFSLFDERWGTL